MKIKGVKKRILAMFLAVVMALPIVVFGTPAVKAEAKTYARKAFGIDVSEYNGTIDWAQIKAQGVEFVMIRVGLRGYLNPRLIHDAKWKANIEGAKANGIKVGVYFVTQAITPAEAIEEANFACDLIKGYTLDLPIAMDYEYIGNGKDRLFTSNQSRSEATAIINAFCATVEARGYKGMLYCNTSTIRNKMYISEIQDKYQIWLANWLSGNIPEYLAKYTDNYSCWQYGTVALYGTCLKENNIGNKKAMATDANYWYLNEYDEYLKPVDRESFGEADAIEYTDGSLAEIEYEAHVQNIGWMAPVKNGQTAGTSGKSLRVEALTLQMQKVPNDAVLHVNAHIQNVGWKEYEAIGKQVLRVGTVGKSQRIEALEMTLDNVPGYVILYRAHVQNIGWTDWVSQGQMAGTTGKSLRIEAVEIKIIPESKIPVKPTIKASAHVQNIGWMNPVGENQVAGTSGRSLRVEAFKFELGNVATKTKEVTKTEEYVDENGETQTREVTETVTEPEIYLSGSAHVQNIGWMNFDRIDPNTEFGTSGKSLRVESINLKLNNCPGYKLQYRAHIQNVGWTGWIDEGKNAGTTGRSLRLEAVQFRIVSK